MIALQSFDASSFGEALQYEAPMRRIPSKLTLSIHIDDSNIA
ncbi:hypothetical protein [Bradyrhizobium ontarionense]|nr:hypothetical protein [Bradyrhizobium sp. A19]